MNVSHSEDEGYDHPMGQDDEEDDDDASEMDEDSDEVDDEEEDDDDKKEIENKGDGNKPVLSLEERREKAKMISSTRILSQKEFQKVRAAQLAKKVNAALPRRFVSFVTLYYIPAKRSNSP